MTIRLLAGVVLAAAAVLYVLALWKVPDLMHLRTAQDRYNSRVLVISSGGAVVVATGLLYTARNYRLSHRGQVTERFTKALERLGSDELYVRIGGVHALEHVMRDSADHHDDVVEVLVSFVRGRVPQRLQSADTDSWVHPVTGAVTSTDLPDVPDADVQAALTAIVNRPRRPERESIRLAGLHLARASLRGGNLEGADLRGANLNGADLNLAELVSAYLSGADLSGALLYGADLWTAKLDGINLMHAELSGAHLDGALLNRADLRGAILNGADLANASLELADLRGAQIIWANLTHAGLGGADLTDADLTGADLSYAHLYGKNGIFHTVTDIEVLLKGPAKLAGATLTCADLTGAKLHWVNLASAKFEAVAGTFLSSSRASMRAFRIGGGALANLSDAELGPKPRFIPVGWTVIDSNTGRLCRDPSAHGQLRPHSGHRG
jgi:uncharacterized protein YjbI with pentapeptide repeats